MAEKTTIARPYAQAIFELAKQQKDLPKWSDMLALTVAVVTDPQVTGLIGNPRVKKSQLVSLVLDVCGANLTDEAKNVIRVLVENSRLKVLPEIAALYDLYRAEEESTVRAEVISAFPLSKDQETSIATALQKRLGKQVTVTSRIDASIMGGAIIRAGDMVIDGSVTGQLEKLGSALAR